MAEEARQQVLQGLAASVTTLEVLYTTNISATYQSLAVFVQAEYVLSRRPGTTQYFVVPILEDCREHYILRSGRTWVIHLLLHCLPGCSVRRDSRGK